ncbi:hypothetical protein C8J57DRAFT_1561800 [Mycena rebaudengoi]|nr:hypothetical protein C8J57DRAFT_1561800 [Mycena rebaudengoi]
MYPAAALRERVALKDEIIPFSEGIATTTGQRITQIPIRKGDQVVLALASYQSPFGEMMQTVSTPTARLMAKYIKVKQLGRTRICSAFLVVHTFALAYGSLASGVKSVRLKSKSIVDTSTAGARSPARMTRISKFTGMVVGTRVDSFRAVRVTWLFGTKALNQLQPAGCWHSNTEHSGSRRFTHWCTLCCIFSQQALKTALTLRVSSALLFPLQLPASPSAASGWPSRDIIQVLEILREFEDLKNLKPWSLKLSRLEISNEDGNVSEKDELEYMDTPPRVKEALPPVEDDEVDMAIEGCTAPCLNISGDVDTVPIPPLLLSTTPPPQASKSESEMPPQSSEPFILGSTAAPSSGTQLPPVSSTSTAPVQIAQTERPRRHKRKLKPGQVQISLSGVSLSLKAKKEDESLVIRCVKAGCETAWVVCC